MFWPRGHMGLEALTSLSPIPPSLPPSSGICRSNNHGRDLGVDVGSDDRSHGADKVDGGADDQLTRLEEHVTASVPSYTGRVRRWPRRHGAHLQQTSLHCRHTYILSLISRYQKGKPNLDFAEARDSEWQWHQLGRMQVCTSLQTDNHASTPPLSFLQAGCRSCRPTNSVEALKARFKG